MIDGSENAIVSWLLNLRIRMFVKSAVTRFLCSEKENTFFTGPKDRQVKLYPNKKALTLSIGSG